MRHRSYSAVSLRLRLSILTIGYFVVVTQCGLAQTRSPLPSLDRQKQIGKVLSETYGLSKLDSPSKKQETVKALLKTSGDASLASDERYVVLSSIISLARDSGDFASWSKALGALVLSFEVDSQLEKSQRLSEYMAANKTTPTLKPAVEEAIVVANELAQGNRYGDATKLLETAQVALRRLVGVGGLQKAIAQSRAAIVVREADWKSYQAAKLKLNEDPDDPASNQTVGRWHVLQENNWNAGLPFLAKGSDASWKSAAENEQKKPTTVDEQVAVGDAWWEIGEQVSGVAKTIVQSHAGHWYRYAEPNLAPSLKKQLIAKRLEEVVAAKGFLMPNVAVPVAAIAKPSAETVTAGDWVDLLEWAESSDWASRGIDWNGFLEGKPSRHGTTLKPSNTGRFPLPAIIDGDYDLEVDFTRITGPQEAVGVIFPLGIHNMTLELGAVQGSIAGVGHILGKDFAENSTGRRPSLVTNNQRHQIKLRVRNDGTRAAFNVDWDQTKDYITWEGPSNALAATKRQLGPWSSTMIRHVWLISHQGNVTFHKARIRMLTGTVRRDFLTDADRELDRTNGFVRLVGESTVGNPISEWGPVVINQMHPGEFVGWPFITQNFKYCNDFYGVFAPSRIRAPIPAGSKSFSVMGYNDSSRIIRCLVLIDGTQVHDSGVTGFANIKVKIPAKASVLDLIVSPVGEVPEDRCYWCNPRFHTVDDEELTEKLLLRQSDQGKFAISSFSGKKPMLNHNQLFAGNASAPVQFSDVTPCDEFIFAHANSSVSYRIPEGMNRFSAVGYNTLSQHTKFEVWADGNRIFESPRAGVVPIDVRLPPHTKLIDLKVTDLGDTFADHSMWCYPRLYRK